MDTVIRKIDTEKINTEYVKEAGEVLRNGGLVAFPTETVYGLGGNAFDKNASHKIYSAKGRPSDNPLIVHIADEEALEEIAEEIPESAKKLMKAFWPGPLTMVFKKTEKVPYETTGGLDTVAVRMPNHKVALELIRAAGVPVAAPSANTSGRPSPTKAEHVIEDLSGKIDMIIDSGIAGIGIESTIVDMTGDVPMILRPGYITKGMISKILGEVTEDKVVSAKTIEDIGDKDYKPKAPGMKYKHYAPKAELTVFEGSILKVIETINKIAKKEMANGKKVGIIATDETIDKYKADVVVSIGTRKDEGSIARSLYDILRGFDDKDIDIILGESFYEDEFGYAIMNRMIKAAGYKIVEVGRDEI